MGALGTAGETPRGDGEELCGRASPAARCELGEGSDEGGDSRVAGWFPVPIDRDYAEY